ncbi:STAS domain-containing protein [Aquabacterium sp. A3]|uniref:STAS domain-containing protein n=1 Tax=Aquabacterium sp. A3 TaxID=3132829 RepID=UPI00311A34FD
MNTSCHIDVGPELNIVHASELRLHWLEHIQPLHDAVTLNLSAVQEMDSAGLQLLLSLDKCLQHEGKHLQLQQPSRVVRDVLEIFGLGEHFAITAPH